MPAQQDVAQHLEAGLVGIELVVLFPRQDVVDVVRHTCGHVEPEQVPDVASIDPASDEVARFLAAERQDMPGQPIQQRHLPALQIDRRVVCPREEARPNVAVGQRLGLRVDRINGEIAVDDELVTVAPSAGELQCRRPVGRVADGRERDRIVQRRRGGDELDQASRRLLAIPYIDERDVVELGRVRFLAVMRVDDGKAPAFADAAPALPVVRGEEAVACILVVAGEVLRCSGSARSPPVCRPRPPPASPSDARCGRDTKRDAVLVARPKRPYQVRKFRPVARTILNRTRCWLQESITFAAGQSHFRTERGAERDSDHPIRRA